MRFLLVLATALLASACAQQAPFAAPVVTSTTTTTTEAPPPPQPAPPRAPVNPCSITDGACVRLSTSESWLITGGAISYGPVPSAFGMAGHETPTGDFSVLYKVRDDWSVPYDTPMPYTVYFRGDGIAFHQGDLAPASSHGCVHLSEEAAATFFDFLQPGARVQVVA
ncbi:L,D-transpeptidase [Umezawaea endophytica]|uniref:L,D-transpeptidase n=1 Tax=Umezawaea endophytica TaxID=1654476 RepID=A0A9X3AHX6_9PSEU|nr:L,D-transpeptidase [Umezawaea endophytica]MCS7479835.1 L,D-transpeptidase [Umezawaea endophytica]